MFSPNGQCCGEASLYPTCQGCETKAPLMSEMGLWVRERRKERKVMGNVLEESKGRQMDGSSKRERV